MRYRLSFLISLFIFVSFNASANETGVDARILAIGQMPVTSLSLSSADRGDKTRWIAWNDMGDKQSRAHLILLSVPDGTIEWKMDWTDAYALTVKPDLPWLYHGRGVIALKLSFGAAAEQISIYSLDQTDHPVLIAEHLGAATAFRTLSNGRVILQVFQTPKTSPVPSCFAWANDALKRQRC